MSAKQRTQSQQRAQDLLADAMKLKVDDIKAELSQYGWKNIKGMLKKDLANKLVQMRIKVFFYNLAHITFHY